MIIAKFPRGKHSQAATEWSLNSCGTSWGFHKMYHEKYHEKCYP